MTWALFLDTTLCGAAVGLADIGPQGSGDLTWFQHMNAVADSARQLPLLVSEGLKSCCIEEVKIAAIVVATGPGSFTGMRVGLAYAYGLAVGISARRNDPIKWLGLSSLGLVAQERGLGSVFLAATSDAGYVATYDGRSVALSPWKLGDLTTADRLVKSGSICMIGDWSKLSQDLSERHVDYSSVAIDDAVRQAMSSMVRESRRIGLSGMANTMPTPLYLRKSTVEEKAMLSAVSR